MEKQFDQVFLELLKSGSRHEQANYRNCIIEEERRRANHQDLESIRQSYKGMTDFSKSSRNLSAISMTVEIILIIAGVLLIVIDFVRGWYIPAVFMLTITIANAISLKRSIAVFRFYHYAYGQFNNGRVMILTPRSDMEKSFSEIFKVISSDTEEILRSKKAKLDEILGL